MGIRQRPLAVALTLAGEAQRDGDGAAYGAFGGPVALPHGGLLHGFQPHGLALSGRVLLPGKDAVDERTRGLDRTRLPGRADGCAVDRAGGEGA
ncbi:hypothetical protein [Brevundimonas sp. TWP2-3-4b1]|uniref:hypothetical protein n=1 Tax=Brevundimonas sp. TWP2-3-4b1 TaxID=2804580 RepID=UPI003CE9A598